MTDLDPGMEDFVQRLVDELNKHEPFAVMFRRDGYNIVIDANSGTALLGWIHRHNDYVKDMIAANDADIAANSQKVGLCGRY